MRSCHSTYFSAHVAVVFVLALCLLTNKDAAEASQDHIHTHLMSQHNSRPSHKTGFQEISFINNMSNRAPARHRPLVAARQHAFLPARFGSSSNANSTQYLCDDNQQKHDFRDADRIDSSFNATLLDQNKSENIPTASPTTIGSSSRAIKELKGRAQFAGQMEGVKSIAGVFAKFIERLSGRTGRRGARKVASITRTTSKVKTAKRIQAARGMKNVGRRVPRQITKPIGRLPKGKITTSIGKRQATKGAVKYSKGRVPSLVAGKQVTKKVGMAAGSRAKTKVAKRAGRSVAGRSAAAHHRRVLTSAPARRLVLRRLGRGVLIALPAIGGIFAILTFVADCDRIQEEYDNRRSIVTLASLLFIGAACADYIDTLCQMLIAHSLFVHEKGAHLLLSESISTSCAFLSTLFAVVGEILSHRGAEDTATDIAAAA